MAETVALPAHISFLCSLRGAREHKPCSGTCDGHGTGQLCDHRCQCACHLPPPPDLPRGEFICTRLDDGSIRVDHADPRILISAPLLYEIADGCSPWASVSNEPPPREHWDGHGALEGAVLTIRGVNRTVIYRIGEYVPRVHAYIGEWPD